MIVWLASIWGEYELRVRAVQRDFYLCIGYGEIYGYWHRIPEAWFDYQFSYRKYPGLSTEKLSLAERFAGGPPYPTFTMNHPEVMDGFGIPFWNLCLVILLGHGLYHAKRRRLVKPPTDD
ncbi:MAG: hypothetical protein KDN19_20030 [Verrucomicrobiae bacterium]|nr:hypothetical protein [Verrucomicrobiae bacterium]